MKIISFDVGIKNMAYCILNVESLSQNKYSIDSWNVLNFTEQYGGQKSENGKVNSNGNKCSCLLGCKKPCKKPKKASKRLVTTPKKNPSIDSFFGDKKGHHHHGDDDTGTQNGNMDEREGKEEKGKEENRVCGKKAKYEKEGKYYCQTHAIQHSQYWIPKKEYSISYLKKQKVGVLRDIGVRDFLWSEDASQKKEEMVAMLERLYKEKCYQLVVDEVKKKAGDMDLIFIGKAMKTALDHEIKVDEITHVVIENQISPIATRMKTIQGMLAQYFIMKKEYLEIAFVSSANKLKGLIDRQKKFEDNADNAVQSVNDTVNEDKPKRKRKQEHANETCAASKLPVNRNYKENKKDGISVCRGIIESNAQLYQWKQKFDSCDKKDDLADCFLQGIYYLSVLSKK
jgi:hypothetical protein